MSSRANLIRPLSVLCCEVVSREAGYHTRALTTKNRFPVLYITSTRLMLESEHAVREHAATATRYRSAFARSYSPANRATRSGRLARAQDAQRGQCAAPRPASARVARRRRRASASHRGRRTTCVSAGSRAARASKRWPLFHGVSDPRAAIARRASQLSPRRVDAGLHPRLARARRRPRGSRPRPPLRARLRVNTSRCFATASGRCRRARRIFSTRLLPEVKTVADRLRLQIVGAQLRPIGPKRAVADAFAQRVACSNARASAQHLEVASGGGRLSAALPASP